MANVPTTQQQARPPLLRGNTVPLYVRPATSGSSVDADSQQQSLSARPGGAYPPMASRPNDPFARRDTQPSSAGRHPHQPQWQMPPTPPLSTSPSSSESHPDYYPAPGQNGHSYYGHAAPNVVRPARSHTDAQAMSPTVAASPASYNVLRSTHKQRPGATPSASAPMRVDTTPTEHILSACIGPGFNSNCITIAARKGNILDIVADRWDLEDCSHEWHVQFDRDADMNGVHASYSDSILTVRVKRLDYASHRPPQVRS